ncbi:MAG TPA: hypothetical protein PL152_01650 [Steroidobacteraceae bacterium]|nr:hypothetical protein [Steroidobacteraceae bacterium]HQR48006.1 hypothetical protein [Steroidobacteraceae bacterium]
MIGGAGKGPGREDAWPVIEELEDPVEAELVSPASLLRFLGETSHVSEAGEPEPARSEPVPRITRMPEGVRVEERRFGRAVAQWILQVRCECGRRWFEVEEIDTAKCPKCGMLVYVDMEARTRPSRRTP